MQIFEKYPRIKFHENPSSGSLVVPCGMTVSQTDGLTYRHGEVKSSSPQFLERAEKLSVSTRILRFA